MVCSCLLTASAISRAAVARIHAPQARYAIEDLAAVGGPVLHSLCASQQARIGFELAVGREWHPESIEFGVRFGRG